MAWRNVLGITIILVSLVVIYWVWIKYPSATPKVFSAVPVTPVAESNSSPVIGAKNIQINLVATSREQVAAEVSRRDKQDSKWEWKVPISFYGKVIDENGQPVFDADISFQWTNLSAKGTGVRETKTNQEGLFSLGDVEGKRLVVGVTKPGYYSSDSRNRFSFEYANPFEEIYHQPRQDSPVLFFLRKRGAPADLLTKSTEIVLPGDGSATKLNLETGKGGLNGELTVQAWKPWPPRPISPAYDWKVAFSFEEGGFVETSENFPFEAPESGYQKLYTIEMSAALGDQWKVSVERTLYFVVGKPQRYGRLTLRTDGNSRYVFLDYAINRSGSRALEGANAPR